MKKDLAYRRPLTAANSPRSLSFLPRRIPGVRPSLQMSLGGVLRVTGAGGGGGGEPQLIIPEQCYAVVTVMSFLTDHREIHLEVLGRRVLEVHPASVDPLVVELDRLQGECGRFCHGDKVGPGPHSSAVRPVQGLVEGPSPYIETAHILHSTL